jgi:starvation-inducible outer membrane lipoprotein
MTKTEQILQEWHVQRKNLTEKITWVKGSIIKLEELEERTKIEITWLELKIARAEHDRKSA